jgi:hypothetical protein
MRHPLRVDIRKAAEIGASIGYSDLLSFRHGCIESGRMKSRALSWESIKCSLLCAFADLLGLRFRIPLLGKCRWDALEQSVSSRYIGKSRIAD